jgi:murein DD-endopeptidase MepM/ murein hydrolase activator NlpD
MLAMRPATAFVIGILFVVSVAWASVATWFILSQDDVTAQLLRRQNNIQAAYEEKIGALRARVDRIASQKLLEQDSLEDRVAQLVSRQVELETRQAMLFNLGNHIDMAEIDVPLPTEPAVPITAGVSGKPTPVPETGSLPASPPVAARAFAPVESRPSPEGWDPFQLRLRGERDGPPASGRQSRLQRDKVSLLAQLGTVEFSLGQVEADQFLRLDMINSGVVDNTARLREAIIQTGLDPDRLDPTDLPGEAETGIGGPYIPIALEAETGPFEMMVGMLQENLVELDRLRRTTAFVPFGRPVPDRISVSSGFGVRADPFTRRPAMHSGIDFRARSGTPIFATAAGKVTIAEYFGGYGNMVELDHGNRITTRFAHLSSISVKVGDIVAAGTMLGRAGSTGRSTGPHLHYETRVRDKPVDPLRFLRAAALLEPGEDGELEEEAED